jgi:ABC-type lipoprotein export system ATPase subunit
MSEPSIEALRQAFLDPRSRIHQKEEGDPRIVRHDRIESLSVRGVAFLDDQEVTFSPGLNCLIGGRGSGKSSLFEYMRFALRREDDPAARDQVERIRSTLARDSVLRLRWRERDNSAGSPGPEDLFEYRPSVARAQVVSREVADASTIFQGLNVQIFSQREITEIARRPDFLLSLIDGLVGDRLRALRQEETELKEKILHLEQQRQVLARLQGEQRALEQEVQDLDRRWEARSAVQEEQKRQRAAQEADHYLDEVSTRTERIVNDLNRWATDLVETHPPLGSTVQGWPESTYFEALDDDVEIAKQELARSIREAATGYRDRIQDLTTQAAAWPSVRQAIQRAEEDFRAACSRQGLRPEDLEQVFLLDQQRKAKSLELEARKAQAVEIERSVDEHAGLWRRLGEVWRGQTEERRKIMESIERSKAVPKVPKLVDGRKEGEHPSLELRIRYAADRPYFLREWADLAPDARFRLGKAWEDVGSDAFDQFLEADEVSPWEVVESWARGSRSLPPRLADLRTSLEEHLDKKNDLWGRKRLIRIQDSIDLILYRSDGTEAGSLNRKQLSEGQANTAVLMLLLASGDGPILIDQPEDELDSNFIFQQLVPLLREIKKDRQIIVVTHNPNLPVNADAELVYALEARNVDGQTRGATRAQGGLDRDSVKQAVLDILEGSEEAFRQRREKYHF